MSALSRCDNALIKAAYLLRHLVLEARRRPGVTLRLRPLHDLSDATPINIKGGVGFTPQHPMLTLQDRLRQAVARAVAQFNAAAETTVPASLCDLTFNALKNDAYASPVDCPVMQAFQDSFARQNRPWPTPIAWRASCDARIFGNRGHHTVTFGPGDIAEAHSNHEKISLTQLQQALALTTLATLSLTTGPSKNPTCSNQDVPEKPGE